ncbi:MAG: chromosomal replication initiator protein [Candidatus Sumerlaeota bacterium]|nr:chromosomal replication initiator protein [Candidatus Sumerlaeota bacterium]
MKSVYPENLVRMVLRALDPLDVLEYLDHHPESLQRDRGKVRLFCPIHGEHSTRTMTVWLEERRYECVNPDCPGVAGGDLIDLVARARRTHYDSALRHLVDEFQLGIELPQNPEAITAALVEAQNSIELLHGEAPDREEHARLARERLDQVLDEDPCNVQALAMGVRLLDRLGDREAITDWVLRLAEAEEAAGQPSKAEAALHEELERNSQNLPVRRRLADWLRQTGRRDEALSEYLRLAESAEALGDLGVAIQAYRRIQTMGDVGFDAGAVVAQLLLASDNPKEAALELLQQAYRYREQGNPEDAVHALEAALELEPDNLGLIQQLIELQVALGRREAREAAAQAALRESRVMARRRGGEPVIPPPPPDGEEDAGVVAERRARALELAAMLEARNAWREAARGLEVLAAALPADEEVLGRLITAHVREGDENSAMVRRRQLAEAMAERGAFDEARRMFDELTAAAPGDRALLRLCADMERRAGDPGEAAVYLMRLATACENDGLAEKGAEALREVLELTPEDVNARMALIGVLVRLGRPDEAAEALDPLLGKLTTPDNPTRALELAGQALLLLPEYPPLRVQHARLLERLGQVEESQAEFFEAARLLVSAGSGEEAEPLLRRLRDGAAAPEGTAELLADALVSQRRQRDAAEVLREEAAAHQFAGRLDRARELLERSLQLDPGDLAALHRLAEVFEAADASVEQRLAVAEKLVALLEQRGDYPAALREVHRMLEIKHDYVGGRRKLLDLYERLGDQTSWGRSSRKLAEFYREAGDRDAERTVLEETIARRPADREAHERLIRVLIESSEDSAWQKALARYLQVCEADGSIERAASFLDDLAAEHPTAEPLKSALLSLYEKLSRTEEQVAQLLALLALHEERKEWDKAVELYRKLLVLRPEDIEYRDDFIQVLAKKGERREAAREAVAAADLYYHADKPDQARRRFEDALRYDRTNADAHRGIARLALAEGRRPEAVETMCQLAMALAEDQRISEAEGVLEEALAWAPRDPMLRRRKLGLYLAPGARDVDRAVQELDTIARLHTRLGETEESLAARREAVALKPDDVALRRVLVEALLAMGRRSEAVDSLLEVAVRRRQQGSTLTAMEVCEEGVALDEDHVGALALRAELYEELGNKEKALEEWRALAPRLRRISSAAAANGGNGEDAGLALVPEYTLERFVVGDQNRFAFATAMAVAKAPGRTPHNPLFLTADVGLGKTHIMHAIANFVKETQRGARVLYTSAEDFVSELVDAIQGNSVYDFRARYRRVDLLLIDDVHLLAGKTRAQEEFFQIFNSLYQSKKQIVVTSDRPPQDIAHLERRLVSRFGAGVIVDIGRPDYETRVAILKRQPMPAGTATIPEGVFEALAEAVEANVRELMAAYKQLMAMYEHGGATMTPETARQAAARIVGAGVTRTRT